jgi:polar amino acid transport system permease protein
MPFEYIFNFDFIASYSEALWNGFFITLKLSFYTIIFSTILSILLGILMSRKNKWLKYSSILIVDAIRSIPLLVLLLICYYVFPVLNLYTDPFWPALLALSIDTGVFLGDVLRGSIEGLPKGAIMSARVLGMNKLQIIRHIILPEVFRETLPTVTLMYIGVIRVSSLASIIAVYELTHVGDWIISTTYRPLEVYLLIGILYMSIILPLTLLSRRLEKIPYFKRRSI